MRRSATSALAILVFACVSLFNARLSPASVVQRQLNQTLPEVHFDGVAFNDAIDFLRDVSGANISVNWKALSETGVTPDATITLKLRQVSLRKALDLILSEAGGGDKLGFSVDEGVIEIATREIIDSRMYTRVYPIEDLIMIIPDFDDAPDFSLTSQTSGSQGGSGGGGAGGGGGGGGGGGAGGLFANGGQNTSKEVVKSKTERATDLMDLIRNIVQPDVWVENGGKAAIRYWNGNLIVTAPRSVQEAIGGAFD